MMNNRYFHNPETNQTVQVGFLQTPKPFDDDWIEISEMNFYHKTNIKPIRVVVVKVEKPRGWALRWIGQHPPTWILKNNTWAWYRDRKSASLGAEVYNNMEMK